MSQTPCEELIGYDHSRITCGYLAVKETPQGRDLELAVAVVAAVDGSQGKEPVIFLHGGPGGAIVNAARQFASHPMNETRDVILFDQRGSGLSRPIDCPEASSAYLEMLAADLDAKTSTARQANIESACRDRIINQGADLDGYGTRETVGDMEVLREALGVESWNVMGVSYGTTVGLDYVRMHPQHTRALV
ncbi:MAG: alpha/beta fold hydrolase, partial [Pseudomonadota bacterium]